jgi:hypothetical protein
MLSAMPTQQISKMLAVCVGGFIALNAAFYLLSGSYFDSHHGGIDQVALYTPERMMQVRMQFAFFSGTLAVAGFLAGLWPRAVGHALPVLFGLVDLVAARQALWSHTPAVLGATLVIAGLLFPRLAWGSYHRKRAPWAFLVAMCGVFAFIEIFGAPKVRDAVGIGLWTTMTLPGLKVVAMITLISLRRDYGERSAREAPLASAIATGA